MIRKTDFPTLTTDVQSIFNEATRSKIAGMEGLKIFDVKETEREVDKHLILHSIGGVEEVADGQDYPRATGAEGDNISYTQAQYGVNVPVTVKMRLFDLYDEITSVVTTITEEAWDMVDQSLADVLLNGYSTTYTDVYGTTTSGAGPDAASLFASTHDFGGASADTFTNIISDGTNDNPTLSRAAIVNTINVGLKFQDANGKTKPIHYDTLVFGPDLADLATRITTSDQISNSANWDPNMFVKSRVKNLVLWERLAQTGQGTSTTAFWFMYDSTKVKESLKIKFAKRPSLDAPEEIHSNKDWDYVLNYFYSRGLGFPAYIQGSNGTES